MSDQQVFDQAGGDDNSNNGIGVGGAGDTMDETDSVDDVVRQRRPHRVTIFVEDRRNLRGNNGAGATRSSSSSSETVNTSD